MRHLTFLLLAVAMGGDLNAQRTRALEAFAVTMAGSYTNVEQATEDTSYAEAELEIVRIWAKRKDGAWFYVEEAATKNKAMPHRQLVYHVRELNDSTFTRDSYMIRHGERLFGAYRDPLLLESLRADSLDMEEGCSVLLYRQGTVYVGATQGRNCSSQRDGAAYASTEISIFSNRMVNWDRDYNAAGLQVWGHTKGGCVFKKRKRY